MATFFEKKNLALGYISQYTYSQAPALPPSWQITRCQHFDQSTHLKQHFAHQVCNPGHIQYYVEFSSASWARLRAMHAIYIETSGSPLRYNCHRLFPGLRVTIRFLTHVQASHASIGAPSCRDMHLLFARERERERLSANFLSYNQLRSWQCNLYIKKKTLQYTQ